MSSCCRTALLRCSPLFPYTTLFRSVFGAFLFGTCLPRDDRLLQALVERLEHVAILLLMPVFFALAGLSTTPNAFRSEEHTSELQSLRHPVWRPLLERQNLSQKSRCM